MIVKEMNSFRIEHDGNLIVAIYPNGSVTFGPGVTPDRAAEVFWNAVAEYVKAAKYEN
jgi:hypothetical protein